MRRVVDKSTGSNTKRALGGLGALVVILWAVLFLPSWSLDYWRAWLYWIVFSLSISAISVYFLKSDPILIENRLKAGPTAEKGAKQNAIQGLLGAFFILLFVISSLDNRFKWSHAPAYLSIAGDVFVVLGSLPSFSSSKRTATPPALSR